MTFLETMEMIQVLGGHIILILRYMQTQDSHEFLYWDSSKYSCIVIAGKQVSNYEYIFRQPLY